MIPGRLDVSDAITFVAVFVEVAQTIFDFERFLFAESLLAFGPIAPVGPIVPAIQRAVEINLVARDEHEPWIDEVYRLLHPLHLVPGSDHFVILARRVGVRLIDYL